MTLDTERQLKRVIASVEQGVSADRWLGVPVGGRAAWYAEVSDTVELVEAARAAMDLQLPYLVIGQGTHTILHDDGFPGLVIHNQSRGLAFAADQSQVVAESGVSLKQLVIQTANRGFGGLFQFLQPGSVGGTLFYGGSGSLADYVRNLTVLMPPTRLKPEPSIVRSKGSWLASRTDADRTRLQVMREKQADEPQPIILTAQIQLTSLRPDEIARKLQIESRRLDLEVPVAPAIGPLFVVLPHDSLLEGAELWRVKHPLFFVRKEFPNYAFVKPRGLRERGGTAPAAELTEFVAMLQQRLVAELPLAFSVV